MKQIIFITIFVLVFSFVTSAQTKPCPKITLSFPENVEVIEGDLVTFIARVNNEENKELKFKWRFLKNENVSEEVSSSEMIVNTAGLEKLEATVSLANNENCKNEVSAKIKLMPPPIISCYFPTKFYQSSTFGEEEKASLDNVSIEIINNKDFILVILFGVNKNTIPKKAQNQIKKIYNHLNYRGVEKDRIKIVLFVSKTEITEIWTGLNNPTFYKDVTENRKLIEGKESEKFLPKN